MTQILGGIRQNATGLNPNAPTGTSSPTGNVEMWRVISYNGVLVTAKRMKGNGKPINFEKIRKARGLTNPDTRKFGAIKAAVTRGYQLGLKRKAA